MRISDWSSDVCSSDLLPERSDHEIYRGISARAAIAADDRVAALFRPSFRPQLRRVDGLFPRRFRCHEMGAGWLDRRHRWFRCGLDVAGKGTQRRSRGGCRGGRGAWGSEEDTSELKSLMRISY